VDAVQRIVIVLQGFRVQGTARRVSAFVLVFASASQIVRK
jgi:hypothetical protein